MPKAPADDQGPVCPHCLQPDRDVPHFMNETTALLAGRTLCRRAKRTIARLDYWGWACPDGHTCYSSRLPPVPPPETD